MAIQWESVKEMLDSAAEGARGQQDIDSAMHYYNGKMIEALQFMISTATVDGGTCVDGGPVTGATIS